MVMEAKVMSASFFFFQAEDGIRDLYVTGVQTCALPISLANGMKVVLLPKKTRGGTVQFSLRLHQGDERAIIGRNTEATLAASMLSRGTTKRSRQDIEDTLDRL